MKNKSIYIRVSDVTKNDIVKTAEYYTLSVSNYLTLLHITTQDKDSKTNKAIEDFKNNNKKEQ